MRHIFVVNPHSGPADATNQVQQGIAELPFEADCEIYVTSAPGDATSYVKQICKSSTSSVRFYACGGDGTLNEVVNGAVGFAHAEVGCFPCGSGNDFVKYFGGKRAFLDLPALVQGESTPVDVIRVNDKYAINVVNMGFEAKVASRMVSFRRIKLLGGMRAYYGAIIATLVDGIRYRCRMVTDGEEFAAGDLLLCTMANADYVGGSFRCAPRADVMDGMMEVCSVKTISRLRFAKLIGIYKRGAHLDDPSLANIIHYRRARKIEIEAAPGFLLCLDGEIITGSHFTVESVPAALRFILPKGADHSAQGIDMRAEAAV